MKQEQQQEQRKQPMLALNFPCQFGKLIQEKGVFSGNLTRYVQDIVRSLGQYGIEACRNQEIGGWEIPQMVAFDDLGNVVLFAMRNTDDYGHGEGEFLLASLDSGWISVMLRVSERTTVPTPCVACFSA